MKKYHRCRHRTVSIIEFGEWTTEHIRENGKWWHNNEPENYNMKLLIKCYDCGLTRYYWRGSKRLPKWLRDAMDELGI